MPDRDIDDILNDPITTDEFGSGDIPDPEKSEDSVDPDDVNMQNDLELDDEQIDPLGDIGLGDSDFESELENDSLDLPDDSGEPKIIPPEEQVKWTAVPQENGDIWSEHVNGYVLRARPLSAQQGDKRKYAAQLFKDNKIMEKGTIWVDNNADARDILHNIADRILDRLGLVNVSRMKAQPEAPVENEQNNLDLNLDNEDDLTVDDLGDTGEEEEDNEVEDDIENDLDI